MKRLLIGAAVAVGAFAGIGATAHAADAAPTIDEIVYMCGAGPANANVPGCTPEVRMHAARCLSALNRHEAAPAGCALIAARRHVGLPSRSLPAATPPACAVNHCGQDAPAVLGSWGEPDTADPADGQAGRSPSNRRSSHHSSSSSSHGDNHVNVWWRLGSWHPNISVT